MHQYVGHLDEASQDLFPLVGAKVNAKALLAAVVLNPVGALTPDIGAVVPTFVATGPLYFNYLCSQPRHYQAGSWPGLISTQVQNSDALKG